MRECLKHGWEVPGPATLQRCQLSFDVALMLFALLLFAFWKNLPAETWETLLEAQDRGNHDVQSLGPIDGKPAAVHSIARLSRKKVRILLGKA